MNFLSILVINSVTAAVAVQEGKQQISFFAFACLLAVLFSLLYLIIRKKEVPNVRMDATRRLEIRLILEKRLYFGEKHFLWALLEMVESGSIHLPLSRHITDRLKGTGVSDADLREWTLLEAQTRKISPRQNA